LGCVVEREQITRDTSTRDKIVKAADRLFYEKGFEKTSFADIAETVNISRGNFYYHFKSKDDILDAVITQRLANTRQMLKEWEIAGATPEERIGSFIKILIVNKGKIQNYGCPVGSLCAELAKLSHAALDDATELYTLFRVWLRRQFGLLGLKKDSDRLAMHLLARSQGVATLANALHDETFIRREVNEMIDWLRNIIAGTKTQI